MDKIVNDLEIILQLEKDKESELVTEANSDNKSEAENSEKGS